MNRAIKYATDIVSGERNSSKALYRACDRFLNDLKRKDITLNKELLKRILSVVETKLRTSDGSTIKLYNFQVFLLANIYGFYYIEDDRRRCETAFLFFPRSVGKSFIASIIGIIDMLFPNTKDKNPPQVILAANSHKQAGEVFQQAKDICKFAVGNFNQKFTIPRSAFKHQGILQFKPTSATMNTISSDSGTSEGMMPSCFVVDEIHVMKTGELLTSLEYAGAKRESPLGVYISTAGDQIDGILHEKYKAFKDGLEAYNLIQEFSGDVEELELLQADCIDDSSFALIYDLDTEDVKDWENCLTNGAIEKVNPLYGLYGQAKVKRTYEKKRKELHKEPSKTPQFKTKMLNIFVDDADKWVNRGIVNKRMKELKLKDYSGWDAWVGIDLAKKNDLTACSVLLVKDEQYRLFNRAWIPTPTAKYLGDKNLFWKTMLTNNFLRVTDSDSTDYEPMICWLKELRDEYKFNFNTVLYDNFNAEYVVKRLDEENFYSVEHKQTLPAFTSGVCQMETLLLSAESDLLIDYNPLVAYCFDNVILEYDKRGNCKPNKINPHKKIDIAISAIQALGGYIYDFSNGNIGSGGVYSILY